MSVDNPMASYHDPRDRVESPDRRPRNAEGELICPFCTSELCDGCERCPDCDGCDCDELCLDALEDDDDNS